MTQSPTFLSELTTLVEKYRKSKSKKNQKNKQIAHEIWFLIQMRKSAWDGDLVVKRIVANEEIEVC
jgi:hypothetical protein